MIMSALCIIFFITTIVFICKYVGAETLYDHLKKDIEDTSNLRVNFKGFLARTIGYGNNSMCSFSDLIDIGEREIVEYIYSLKDELSDTKRNFKYQIQISEEVKNKTEAMNKLMDGMAELRTELDLAKKVNFELTSKIMELEKK